MVIPPLLDTWDELEDAVEPYLLEMFFAVPTIDLPLLGAEIDAASQPILGPEDDDADSGDGSVGPDPDSVAESVAGSVTASSAASTAVGQQRCGQPDLPRAGAHVAQRDRDRPGERFGLARRGRGPQHAAEVVGGEQVLGRHLCSSDARGDRLAGQQQAPGGDRVLVGPGARRRRPVGARCPGRQLALGQVAYLRSATATQRPA